MNANPPTAGRPGAGGSPGVGGGAGEPGGGPGAGAGQPDWSQDDRMNELETTMWRSERHPQHSSTICSLLILDCVPDWDRLVAAHEWATSLVPRSRQRVVEPLVPNIVRGAPLLAALAVVVVVPVLDAAPDQVMPVSAREAGRAADQP